jgi:hypothetical protein
MGGSFFVSERRREERKVGGRNNTAVVTETYEHSTRLLKQTQSNSEAILERFLPLCSPAKEASGTK